METKDRGFLRDANDAGIKCDGGRSLSRLHITTRTPTSTTIRRIPSPSPTTPTPGTLPEGQGQGGCTIHTVAGTTTETTIDPSASAIGGTHNRIRLRILLESRRRATPPGTDQNLATIATHGGDPTKKEKEEEENPTEKEKEEQ